LPAHLSNLGTPGGGQALPGPVRQRMESFFNTSFADVRVHVGAQASSIGALAFTHGSNLYFAPGQYNPETAQGQRLIGHELTHVIQQRAGRVHNPFGAGIVVARNIKHAFAAIGNPRNDRPEDVIVADAWVRYPRACRFSEHFCRNERNLEVVRSKIGPKAGRTATLGSKYWDMAALPGYVGNLKNTARTQPRGASSWNHENVTASGAVANYIVNR
jgi:hypothetical protein